MKSTSTVNNVVNDVEMTTSEANSALLQYRLVCCLTIACKGFGLGFITFMPFLYIQFAVDRVHFDDVIVAAVCVFGFLFFFGLGVYIKHELPNMRKDLANSILPESFKSVYGNASFDYDLDDETDTNRLRDVCVNYGITEDNRRAKYYSHLSFDLNGNTVHEFDCRVMTGRNKEVHSVFVSDSSSNQFESTQIMVDNTLSGFDGVVRIISSKPELGAISGRVKNEKISWPAKTDVAPEHVDVNNEFFDSYFEVYASSSHDAFYILNPYVVEKLAKMRMKYNNFMICVTNDFIAVSFDGAGQFIASDFDNFKNVQMIVEESKEGINTIVNELTDVAQAISRHKNYDSLKDITAVEA